MLGSDLKDRPTPIDGLPSSRNHSLRNWILAGFLLAGLGIGVGGFIASGPVPTTAAENRAVEELTTPRTTDRNVTKVVNAFMNRDHLSQHALDDEIARRALTLFVKSLDSQKLYFYQTDIDEFNKNRDQIDDQVKAGDISFAYTVFQRLLKRVDERVDMIDRLLEEPVDFTTDEVLLTDRDKLTYPRTPDEAKDRWRKRLKYDMLVLRADKSNKEDVKVRLKRRYHSFARRMHQTDADELLEMYLTSVTMSYDPHTTYMSPNSLENFKIMMRLNLDGIGAQLQSIDGYCVVSKVIPGGAADKNGELKEEDKIVSVGQGSDGEMIDVVDTKLNDVVDMIRGRAGTIVRLGVMPAVGGEIKIINITRAKIELTDDSARGVIFEDGKKEDGTPYKIGVIDLPSFYSDMEASRAGNADFKSSTRDVKRLLVDFNSKGVDALILDLRRNGGGSLSEAISLTGLFIDVGPVVQVKDPDGRVDHHDDTDPGMTWKGPMVVVTSKFSASASEILAGAIQDYKRGLVVGDTSTHGKGTVQSLLDLGPQVFRVNNPPNLGALKITMQQFYRPNGDSTQLRGVLADVVLPSITDHMDVSESDLDFAIPFDKVPAARLAPYSLVSPDLISALRTDSANRRAQSADFTKLLRNIDRYVEQKSKKEVPLNEKVFLAQREELDAEKEEEKTLLDQTNGPKEVVKRDFYFNEVMAITVDYLKQLGQNKTVAQAR